MKTINRRAVLRGMGGIALGLPWLEANGQFNIKRGENVRLAFLSMPNGVDPDNWDPIGSGTSLSKLSKSLAPLEKLKSKINVHTNLRHAAQSGHNQGLANFLSGVEVKKGSGDFGCAITADQLAAKFIGKDTSLPSLELSLAGPRGGVTNSGYRRALGAYISWASPTVPVPREIIPANAFNRLFKGAQKTYSTPDETKSILDYIKDDTARMKRFLGREDTHRIDQYFHSVRALELRLKKVANDDYTMPRDAKAPQKGVPKDFDTHAKLMSDIIVLAFQTNRTKVASLMYGIGTSQVVFRNLGVNTGHHSTSHYGSDKTKKANIEKISRYHVSLYSYMLQKMDSVKEGDKTLLDNSLVLFGSGMITGNTHNARRKPIIVAGSAGGKVKTGLHHVYKKNAKMTNLLLGMLKTVGCPINKFGNSDAVYI